MKKIIIVVIFAQCIIFSCHQKDTNGESIPHITSTFTEEIMTIDGDLKEPIWQTNQSIVLRENKTGNEVTDPEYRTEVRTAFDTEYLYISFLCYDPDIWGKFSDRDQHLWTEEAVEVFIDTDRESNTYVELEVSPKNVLFDSYIVDPINIDIQATKEFDLMDIKTGVIIDGSLNDESDEDHYWSVETAIPLKEIVKENQPIIPGQTVWKINFYRIERKRNGESTGYAWSPTGARFHRPEVFGVLRFGDRN
jgi:hypothetical protein